MLIQMVLFSFIELNGKAKGMSCVMKVRCKVKNDKERSLLLDSGASISLVNEDVPFSKSKQSSICVRYANGTKAILNEKRYI